MSRALATTIPAPKSTTVNDISMVDDISVLLPDWRTHLRARNIAPSTIASYLTVGENFLGYLRKTGMPTAFGSLARDHLEAFLADLSDRVSPATTAKHYRSLQQLFRWLVEDGEIADSPMARMRPPQVPEQPVDVFTDDELARLLKVSQGNTFERRRDTALLRMLLDTGMRSAELCGLAVDDLDPEQRLANAMGKGRRGRAVPYGAQTADALRRYLRARAVHPQAARRELWLGRQGPLSDSGLRQILERRGIEAGVPNVGDPRGVPLPCPTYVLRAPTFPPASAHSTPASQPMNLGPPPLTGPREPRQPAPVSTGSFSRRRTVIPSAPCTCGKPTSRDSP